MSASPNVLISPEHLTDRAARYVKILESAGFLVSFATSSDLSRGTLSEQETVAALSHADAVIAGGERYSLNVIEQLPRLRVIARCGVGYDRVDVPAATSRGVIVAITPTANHECVAEHTLSMLFAAAKQTIRNDQIVRAGKWNRPLTEPVRGRTFGILGLGRIGRSTALRVKSLGMNVIAHEPYPNPAFVEANAIRIVSLEELFAQSDYVSLHCPMTDESRGIVNRRTLALMKPTAVLINTARGGLVNETDLLIALQEKRIAGACLDVFEPEPPATNHEFFRLENVILAPHLGGMDKQSVLDMGIESAQNIASLYQGEWPAESIVNGELRGAWKFSHAKH